MDKFAMNPEDLGLVDPYSPFFDVEFMMRAPNGKLARLTLRFRPRGLFRRVLAKVALWFSGIELLYSEEEAK